MNERDERGGRRKRGGRTEVARSTTKRRRKKRAPQQRERTNMEEDYEEGRKEGRKEGRDDDEEEGRRQGRGRCIFEKEGRKEGSESVRKGQKSQRQECIRLGVDSSAEGVGDGFVDDCDDGVDVAVVEHEGEADVEGAVDDGARGGEAAEGLLRVLPVPEVAGVVLGAEALHRQAAALAVGEEGVGLGVDVAIEVEEELDRVPDDGHLWSLHRHGEALVQCVEARGDVVVALVVGLAARVDRGDLRSEHGCGGLVHSQRVIGDRAVHGRRECLARGHDGMFLRERLVGARVGHGLGEGEVVVRDEEAAFSRIEHLVRLRRKRRNHAVMPGVLAVPQHS
mmetsp:Transcript_18909/g.58247  ORF Transcript_18909/g.58247 Transcript_18909/m.58247 type:complete len:338 (-) Transcript_18909:626-1639(-)